MQSGYDAMRRLLGLAERPTAVFCSTNDMAFGAMKACIEAGLKVPEHISLVGFDDNHFSAYLTPALTTVRRPIELISSEGATRLIHDWAEADSRRDNFARSGADCKAIRRSPFPQKR